MPLDPVVYAQTGDQYDDLLPMAVEPEEEVGFEEIQKQMGILLILVSKDRRNNLHHRSEMAEKAHRVEVKKQVDTFRGWELPFFTGGKCTLQLAKLGTLVAPAEWKESVTALVNGADQTADVIKQLFDTSVQGNRTEIGAQAEHLRSISEQIRHEHQRYLSDEAEAIRKFEQQRNKQEDFMMSMARGG
ncbi:MAG: hypothetical protein JSR46_04520 [Verrucomicrobia bacterium]|nr:hypothetical protein [Verrucomicrobiota bacterium]